MRQTSYPIEVDAATSPKGGEAEEPKELQCIVSTIALVTRDGY
jgi:hypothetical protein